MTLDAPADASATATLLAGPFPRPSANERRERWAAFDRLLAAEGLDVAVVTGHAGGRQELQYLANAPVRWESFLVAGPSDEPHLYVQLFNHVPTMAEWATVPVSWAGPSPLATVGDAIRTRVGEAARIGLLGPWSERAAGALREALPRSTLRTIGPAFERTRLIKSAEELDWVAHAASLCDDAIDVFCAEARVGMREDELAWLLQSGYADRGGQTGIAFLAIVPRVGGGAVVPSQAPTGRRVRSGDVVVFELSAGVGGVTSQVLRTVAIGDQPAAEVVALHDLADTVVDGLLALVRPGTTAAGLEAVGGLVDRAGATIVDDLVHGYVGGYLPPVLRTPATRQRPTPDLALASGMCLVLQPNVVSGDGRWGVQTGELVAVSDTGVRRFHAAPRGLLHAG